MRPKKTINIFDPNVVYSELPCGVHHEEVMLTPQKY